MRSERRCAPAESSPGTGLSDSLFVKSRHDGSVNPKAGSVALGGTLAGGKRTLRPLGQCERRRQILVSGLYGSPTPRCQRLLRGLCRWADWVARAPRCSSALCITSDNPCGMWCGDSGVPWPWICAPFMERRRSRKPSGLGARCSDVGCARSDDQHEVAARLDATDGLL